LVCYLVFALGITVLVRFLSGSLLGPSLAIACLIVLLLRDKLSRVVIASTLVIIFSSFVSIEENFPHYVIDNSEKPEMQGSKGQNPLIHMVFDEAAGISSLSLAGKQGEASLSKLTGVLTKHGFTSIRNAHSSSMWTAYALEDMFNLHEVATASENQQSFRFEKNPLFELLDDQGYAINVTQSSYLDFCSSKKSSIRSCYEYPINSLLYFADNGLDKLSVMVPITLMKIRLLHRFQQLIPRWRIWEYLGIHQHAPAHFESVSVQSVQSDFIARLAADAPGKDQYYLLHFLYPHHPYLQKGDCQIKLRFDDWGGIGRWGNSSEEKQDLRIQKDERESLYQNYFEQYECFTKVLDGVLDQLLRAYPDAIVIVHGDHSSRISTRHINDYSVESFSYLDQQNYSDLYPTLLAMKYSGNMPGIVDCRISLIEFAQHFFQGQVGALGEKTKIIADRLFADSDTCIDQLPTLSSLR
jgi:hypothetical protein